MCTVLAGKTVPQMRQFFLSNGTRGSYLRDNQAAMELWIGHLKGLTPDSDDHQVLDLVPDMCTFAQEDRPSATEVVSLILDFEGQMYYDFCCDREQDHHESADADVTTMFYPKSRINSAESSEAAIHAERRLDAIVSDISKGRPKTPSLVQATNPLTTDLKGYPGDSNTSAITVGDQNVIVHRKLGSLEPGGDLTASSSPNAASGVSEIVPLAVNDIIDLPAGEGDKGDGPPRQSQVSTPGASLTVPSPMDSWGHYIQHDADDNDESIGDKRPQVPPRGKSSEDQPRRPFAAPYRDSNTRTYSQTSDLHNHSRYVDEAGGDYSASGNYYGAGASAEHIPGGKFDVGEQAHGRDKSNVGSGSPQTPVRQPDPNSTTSRAYSDFGQGVTTPQRVDVESRSNTLPARQSVLGSNIRKLPEEQTAKEERWSSPSKPTTEQKLPLAGGSAQRNMSPRRAAAKAQWEAYKKRLAESSFSSTGPSSRFPVAVEPDWEDYLERVPAELPTSESSFSSTGPSSRTLVAAEPSRNPAKRERGVLPPATSHAISSVPAKKTSTFSRFIDKLVAPKDRAPPTKPSASRNSDMTRPYVGPTHVRGDDDDVDSDRWSVTAIDGTGNGSTQAVDPRPIDINVKLLGGKVANVNINLSASVLALKRKIGKIESVPIDTFRLKFAGEELADHWILSACRIDQDSMVRMLVRSPMHGGQTPQNIIIKFLYRKPLNVKIPLSATVLELKREIEELESVQPEEVRLVFNGEQLLDHKILSEYRISNDSTVHLIGRVRGSVPK